MYPVSEKFKQYCKRHQRTFKNATITYVDDNEQTQTISSDKIIKIEISATPYIDYQIIGQAVAKKIHINLYGQDYDLINREIQVSTTMIYDDTTTETLNLGTYIISSDYESSVKDQCSYTGYDYMIKLDHAYSDEGLEYPCTLQDVLNDICNKNDIELYSTYIMNGDLEVTGNNFKFEDATYRNVLQQIAQASGTFAFIDRANKLHIENFTRPGKKGGTILQFPLQETLQYKTGSQESNIQDDLTPSYYMTDFKQAREYGPVNKVQIVTSGVDDATYIEDLPSINANGIQTVTIKDNYFLGTIEAREHAIEGLWNALYNMRYTPMSTTYLGFPYLEMGDLIELVLPNESVVQSYVFNYTFAYDGGYMGTIETPTISRTQETYPTDSIDSRVSKIGVNVDRANAEISAVVEDVDGISAELSLKIDKDDNDQIVSMINASADVITLNSNRLIINSTYFTLDANGYITATGGDIGGFSLGTNTLSCDISTTIGPFTSSDQERVKSIIMGDITPTAQDYEKYDIDKNGVIDILDSARISRAIANGGYYTFQGTFTLDTNDYFSTIKLDNGSSIRSIGLGGVDLGQIYISSLYAQDDEGYFSYISSKSLSIGQAFDNSTSNVVSINVNNDAYLQIDSSSGNWCRLNADTDASLTLNGGTPSIYIQGTTPSMTFNDNGTTTTLTMENSYLSIPKARLTNIKSRYSSTDYTGTTFDNANGLYIALTNSSGTSVTGYLHCRVVNGIICAI